MCGEKIPHFTEKEETMTSHETLFWIAEHFGRLDAMHDTMIDERVTYRELLRMMDQGLFRNMEHMLPIMLSEGIDTTTDWTYKKLFYQLCAREMEQTGPEAFAQRVRELLIETREDYAYTNQEE